MSNPNIVTITKERLITKYEDQKGFTVTLYHSEGIADDGTRYSWVQSTITHQDQRVTSKRAHSFKELYND